jgi:hypothetical protein
MTHRSRRPSEEQRGDSRAPGAAACRRSVARSVRPHVRIRPATRTTPSAAAAAEFPPMPISDSHTEARIHSATVPMVGRPKFVTSGLVIAIHPRKTAASGAVCTNAARQPRRTSTASPTVATITGATPEQSRPASPQSNPSASRRSSGPSWSASTR